MALIGITSERNVTSSRRNAAPSAKPNTIGGVALQARVEIRRLRGEAVDAHGRAGPSERRRAGVAQRLEPALGRRVVAATRGWDRDPLQRSVGAYLDRGLPREQLRVTGDRRLEAVRGLGDHGRGDVAENGSPPTSPRKSPENRPNRSRASERRTRVVSCRNEVPAKAHNYRETWRARQDSNL
jgi:hypothetical protein